MDPSASCKAIDHPLCSPAGSLLWHVAFAPSPNTAGGASACPGFFPGSGVLEEPSEELQKNISPVLCGQ